VGMQPSASSAAPPPAGQIASDLERIEPAPDRGAPEGTPEAPEATSERVLDEQKWDEREAVRAAANRELHADLLGATVDRIAAIALAGAAILAAYVAVVLFIVPRSEPPWQQMWGRYVALLGAGVLASFGLFGVTRVRRLRAQAVHDLGYVYLFVLSFLLGLLRHSQAWPAAEVMREVSPVVIPILAFAALIPAPPNKALMVALGAACMDPLAFYLVRSGEPLPRAYELLLVLASPFLAAVVAHRVSLVVHRLSAGIVKAREIGSYRLVERLGVGGMAEVWRADHRMLARPAAVKLIRPQVLIEHGPQDAERLLRLFAREARTTASLRSPHTIQLYDFGITREGAFYYVMELLDGIDLKTLVERFGPQPAERVAQLLRQACHSLAEAHENAFVHRDVKPANIYTCHYGIDYDFVKVLDFGLVLDRHPTAEELEDERRFIGTPAVMAPEMVRFHAPVDARADIYALGCVGYWLLTGKRVFDAGTRHDLLVMHAHQKPITPSKSVGLALHAGLEAVIMACLEKNPNRRPQTAKDLDESLAALSFEHPWTAERAALWWRRHLDAVPASEPAPPASPADTRGA